MSLLHTRRFLPLFVTQFLGAFNDNFFKSALVMLVTFRELSLGSLEGPMLVTLAAGLFILPFFLFSAMAGQLADSQDRTRIARIVKLAEIVLMALGWIGFAFHILPLLFLVLFGMGVHSTFFGPIKYAILPQHLEPDELLKGNAYIEAATFLAILFGTIAGGLLVLQHDHLFGAAALLCAGLGYAASRYIPTAPAAETGQKLRWNIGRETYRILRDALRIEGLRFSILSISWFWLIGATFLSQFPGLARHELFADETVVTLLLTVFSVGIGLGSALSTRLLGNENRLVFVKWASLVMTIFTVDFAFAVRDYMPMGDHELAGALSFLRGIAGWRISFDLLMVAVAGGVYIVPLYTKLQQLGHASERARIIAANNISNAGFMVLSALFTLAMLSSDHSILHIFLVIAGLNGMVTLWFFYHDEDAEPDPRDS